MRIGYCSPFNPMKSGISDFSEDLVLALANLVEIVVFSPENPDNTEVTSRLECHTLSELDKADVRNSLDLLIYHVGNNNGFHGEIVEKLNRYPGIVELHEIGLHHLVAAQTLEKKGKSAYLEMVEYCHGQRGLSIAEKFLAGESGTPWDEHGLDMCMARPVIEAATAIIVHSELAKQMVLGIRPDVPIVNILLHTTDLTADRISSLKRCRRELELPEKQIIFGAFGFATGEKRILQILDVLQKLFETGISNYHFFIVGQVEEKLRIADAIKCRGLEQQVTVTGFTSLEQFKTYMGACDFGINLRYPTQGESSASLCRMLGMGIPAIVTDIGTFADFPDDIVIKVRHDENEVSDLYKAIRMLILNRDEVNKRGIAARKFAAKYCSLSKNAVHYSKFFEEMIHFLWQPEYEDVVIGRLCELGLTEEAYVTHVFHQCAAILQG